MTRDDLNINTQDREERTAFHYACEQGKIETVKLLMDRDVPKRNAQDGVSNN